jgi:hypothetical protein
MHSYETEKHNILLTFASLGKTKTLLSMPYNTGASKSLRLNGFYIVSSYITHARIFVVNYSVCTV